MGDEFIAKSGDEYSLRERREAVSTTLTCKIEYTNPLILLLVCAYKEHFLINSFRIIPIQLDQRYQTRSRILTKSKSMVMATIDRSKIRFSLNPSSTSVGLAM